MRCKIKATIVCFVFTGLAAVALFYVLLMISIGEKKMNGDNYEDYNARKGTFIILESDNWYYSASQNAVDRIRYNDGDA